MSATYLDSIVAYHRARAQRDERPWADRPRTPTSGPSLTAALRGHRPQGVAVIAEIKRRSPSKGWLDEHLDAVSVARDYVAGGASGVSVLTDDAHFGGTMEDLVAVCAAVPVPVLRKDFIVAPNDVLDAALAGAGAVLLIVAALDTPELARLVGLCTDVGLDALVEVHTLDEARVAMDCGAELIGVNQRDLHSFDVDASRAEAVVAALSGDVVTVAESGFSDSAAVARAGDAGFDAVLVGEAFVRSLARSDAVRSFVGFPIGRR